MRWILLILVVAIFSCKDKKPEVRLYAGAAAAPVNPPTGSFIAGADRNRTFTGVRDSLFAKAIVVSDGQRSLAVVTIDCIGLLYPEVKRIQELAAAGSSVPADHIVVSSTHTHAGPDVVGIWGQNPMTTGRDTAYLSLLVWTAAQQIIVADKNKVEARLMGLEGVYRGDWFANICNEELDPSLSVLQFKSTSGSSIATLTNFACHPTFLDTHFSVVSSDYPGAFYKQMDKVHGGVNLFLQGAIGGWVQPKDELFSAEEKSEIPFQFQLADRYGRDLADSVTHLLTGAQEITDGAIDFRKLDFNFPVDNPNWKLLSQAGVIHREVTDSVETSIAWFSIGPAQFATHPGETSPWLGLQTRTLMNSGPRFVLGLSQDALGYILKPEFFTDSTRLHSGYLTSMSLGPQTTPILLERLKRIVK